MYIILVNDENELYASLKERIMQRSKLVDKMVFLVDQEYKGLDMSTFTVNLEYLTPISREYHSEILTLSDELYEDKKLQYFVPFDTALTKEAGDIQIQLTFSKVQLDTEGNGTQYVRKTSPCKITIVPIAAWSDIIPDSALNAVDQKLVAINAQIEALNDIAETYNQEKADNIDFNEDGDVQLKSMGSFIGNSLSVAIPGTEDNEDGEENGVIDADKIYEEVII